jgi:hypothetical protein
MSVSFFAEITSDDDTRVFRVVCATTGGRRLLDEYVGHAAAAAAAKAHGQTCRDSLCSDYGASIEQVETTADPRPVNMTASNAARVLRALGLRIGTGGEPSGRMDALRFADLAEDTLANPGLEDYLVMRLRELRDLAVKCAAINARICWA